MTDVEAQRDTLQAELTAAVERINRVMTVIDNEIMSRAMDGDAYGEHHLGWVEGLAWARELIHRNLGVRRLVEDPRITELRAVAQDRLDEREVVTAAPVRDLVRALRVLYRPKVELGWIRSLDASAAAVSVASAPVAMPPDMDVAFVEAENTARRRIRELLEHPELVRLRGSEGAEA